MLNPKAVEFQYEHHEDRHETIVRGKLTMGGAHIITDREYNDVSSQFAVDAIRRGIHDLVYHEVMEEIGPLLRAVHQANVAHPFEPWTEEALKRAEKIAELVTYP